MCISQKLFQYYNVLWDLHKVILYVPKNSILKCFSATIQAISVYLDAFQKIADAATNSRGKL